MRITSSIHSMKSILLPGLALLLSLTSTTLAQENQEKSTEQFVSEVDKKIPQLLQDFSVPGAAIAIIEHGETVLQKGYGFSNIGKQVKVWKSGLLIDNGPPRGLDYTDTLGTNYSFRTITATITNDSTIPIHIQIALSKEYDFPAAYGDQKFKVFLLPKELTPDKETWDSMSYVLGNNYWVYKELSDFFERGLNPPYILNETLEPGEKCDITIGTLYPRPTKISGVLPNALFSQNNRGLYHECDSLINQDYSTNSQLSLWLKLVFKESCTIIPCGQISYPEP